MRRVAWYADADIGTEPAAFDNIVQFRIESGDVEVGDRIGGHPLGAMVVTRVEGAEVWARILRPRFPRLRKALARTLLQTSSGLCRLG